MLVNSVPFVNLWHTDSFIYQDSIIGLRADAQLSWFLHRHPDNVIVTVKFTDLDEHNSGFSVIIR